MMGGATNQGVILVCVVIIYLFFRLLGYDMFNISSEKELMA